MDNLAQLETQKEKFLAAVQGWPPSRLSYRPAPLAWSAIDVFDHLVKTEDSILNEARQGVAKQHRVGLREYLGSWFTKIILQSERKVKVPSSATQVLPDPNNSMGPILRKWKNTRDELRMFYCQLSLQQTRFGIFRHPVAGWMNAKQVVEFFAVHMTHHSFQIARLSKESQPC